MRTREQLEKRISDLERQLSSARGTIPFALRGIRRRAGWEIANLPFYDIAVGPDPERGEYRGHARGVIAIGDFASGVVAIGGLARGVIALGGLALGLVSFGGLSVGALVAMGGLAIGGLAMGGGAVGGVALGGLAAGEYACGGLALGEHVVGPTRRDPEAVRFFREHDIGGTCAR